MDENLLAPLFLQLLRIFSQILVQIPPESHVDPQSSLRLRTVILKVYNETIFQMRFNGKDHHDYDQAIIHHFEGIIWTIYNLYSKVDPFLHFHNKYRGK